jgi:hypothetical protein
MGPLWSPWWGLVHHPLKFMSMGRDKSGPYARPLLASLVRAFCGFTKKCLPDAYGVELALPWNGLGNYCSPRISYVIVHPGDISRKCLIKSSPALLKSSIE